MGNPRIQKQKEVQKRLDEAQQHLNESPAFKDDYALWAAVDKLIEAVKLMAEQKPES